MPATATPSRHKKGRLSFLALSDLMTDPNQPRKFIDPAALSDLTASIAEKGVLVPVLFRCDPQGNNLIVAGERRVAAARLAGLTTIPAIFTGGSGSEISLIENTQRQDLTAIEEAEGLQSLAIEQQYTQEQLGKIVGKARNTLSEILSLNKLPQEIRDDCRGDRTITQRELVAIAKKKEPAAMITAYQALKAKLHREHSPSLTKDPNDPRPFLALLTKTTEKIAALDTSAWTPEERQAYLDSLTSLRTQIDATLNPPPPPPSKK